MNADFEGSVQALLDGSLSEEEREALNETLRHDEASRRAFAGQMRLHALLTWRTGAVTPVLQEVKAPVVRVPKPVRWQWVGWAAAALFMIGFSVMLLAPSPAAAALSQMIAALDRALDRTYTISVTEGDAWQPLRDGRQIGYEGARLHLRGRSQFVLVRALDRGGEVITGSDGQSNWDIRGKGPVRVTSDMHRFRGGLPGEYQNVPFLDLNSLLGSLGEDYDLTLSDDDAEPGLQRLSANKRHRDKRGLPRMEFVIRKDTGTIVKMELRGLPQEKGGPRAVVLTLTSESGLSEDFFTHQAHHEADREVIVE